MVSLDTNQTQYFVLTANRLLDGRVVWLTPNGYWGVRLEDARFFLNKADAEQEQNQIASSDSARFLIDLHCTELKASLLPLTTREQIRAFGPSTHPEFNLRSITE